jgi:ABC-type transporter Mla MlaB component
LRAVTTGVVEIVIPCDVAWIARGDVQVVDALARLHLAAKRRGCSIVFGNASRDLDELVGLMGLADVLAVEPRWEAEQREERLGVEEECDLLDPPA